MILSSGKLKVTENKNKSALFFEDVEVGDVVEVIMVIGDKIYYSDSRKLTEVKNHTKGTNRTGSPLHIGKGMDKMQYVREEQ